MACICNGLISAACGPNGLIALSGLIALLALMANPNDLMTLIGPQWPNDLWSRADMGQAAHGVLFSGCLVYAGPVALLALVALMKA
jgi:hypothetical protein